MTKNLRKKFSDFTVANEAGKYVVSATFVSNTPSY